MPPQIPNATISSLLLLTMAVAMEDATFTSSGSLDVPEGMLVVGPVAVGLGRTVLDFVGVVDADAV